MDDKAKVRELLRKQGIKLWEAPYTHNSSGNGNTAELEILAQLFTNKLPHMTIEELMVFLEELRVFSYQKLQERNRGKEVNVRVRVGLHGDKREVTFKQTVSPNLVGKEFCAQVSNAISQGTTQNTYKVIFNGKIVGDTTPMASFFHGFEEVQILAIPINVHDDNSPLQLVQKAIRAAESMADNEERRGSSLNMQLEDQDGKPIKLPPQQNKALMIAMTLHEKGRAAMKREEFGTALAFLLEADSSFSQLSSWNPVLMESIDNHALLQLDIVWTFFQLKEMSSLSDAERRLQRCRDFLEKAHGAQLERLRSIRNTTPPELCLYARLNAMQAVVAYHSGWVDVARDKLHAATDLIKAVSVDDTALTQLCNLGFSMQEARFGLRSCDGNVDAAAEFLWQRQEKEREKRNAWRRQKRWGRTTSGKRVDKEAVDFMVGAGIAEEMAVAALKFTDNNTDRAMQLIDSQPELLFPSTEPENDPQPQTQEPPQQTIDELASMGFDPALAAQALKQADNSIERAIQILTDPSLAEDLVQQLTTPTTQETPTTVTTISTTNNTTTSTTTTTSTPPAATTTTNDDAMQMSASEDSDNDGDDNDVLETLGDIDGEGMDYLDLDLGIEREIVRQYTELCNKSMN